MHSEEVRCRDGRLVLCLYRPFHPSLPWVVGESRRLRAEEEVPLAGADLGVLAVAVLAAVAAAVAAAAAAGMKAYLHQPYANLHRRGVK